VRKLTKALVIACKNDPLRTSGLLFIFYTVFTFLEGMLEELIFGERFLHALDPIFLLLFMGLGIMCVWGCYINNKALYSCKCTERDEP
jgi:hypothetical protein